MESITENIAVVVFTNRKDFFLSKICVASIRFYYPAVEIFLVKDKLNGDFNTHRLKLAFNVKVLDLGKKYYGWSAAKIFFLLQKNLPNRRYLCIDADIIFVGKVLDKIGKIGGDFVLNAYTINPPFSTEVTGLYIDPEKVKVFYPDYQYPGYFFNAGQTVVTPGLLEENLLEPSFDPHTYPYYKNKDTFGLVDQAVLNAALPVLARRKNVVINTLEYMQWSVSFFGDKDKFKFVDFKDGKNEYLVHYAGDTRVRQIEKMRGADLLQNFRDQYYTKLTPIGRLLDKLQDKITTLDFYNKFLYKKNRVLIELQNRGFIKKQ